MAKLAEHRRGSNGRRGGGPEVPEPEEGDAVVRQMIQVLDSFSELDVEMS